MKHTFGFYMLLTVSLILPGIWINDSLLQRATLKVALLWMVVLSQIRYAQSIISKVGSVTQTRGVAQNQFRYMRV